MSTRPFSISFDADGYPDDDSLEEIEHFKLACQLDGGPTIHQQCKDLLDAIGRAWHFGDWGWKCALVHPLDLGKPVWRYTVSTGGWSGNESLIGAMQANRLLWMLTWVSSRRGGHYEFEVGE